MKKLLELVRKAKHYLGVALEFLKKLVGAGEKADKALDAVEDKLEEEAKKEEPKE